jgi:hypothetical protein
MFVMGSSLAVIILLLTYLSPEPEAWKQHRMGSVRAIFKTSLPEHGQLLVSASGHGGHVLPVAWNTGLNTLTF